MGSYISKIKSMWAATSLKFIEERSRLDQILADAVEPLGHYVRDVVGQLQVVLALLLSKLLSSSAGVMPALTGAPTLGVSFSCCSMNSFTMPASCLSTSAWKAMSFSRCLQSPRETGSQTLCTSIASPPRTPWPRGELACSKHPCHR